MKRILVFGAFLLAASFAFTAPVSMGVLATWSPLEGDYQTVTYLGSTLTDNFAFETLGLKAFVDFSICRSFNRIGHFRDKHKRDFYVSWNISVGELPLFGDRH